MDLSFPSCVEISSTPPENESPNATLAISMDLVNSTIFFFAIPMRPPASAILFSSSRLVRVSIFLNSSFIATTSSLVIPVVFITSAYTSSILATSSASFLNAKEAPVIVPIIVPTTARLRLNQLLILENPSLARWVSDLYSLESAAVFCRCSFRIEFR